MKSFVYPAVIYKESKNDPFVLVVPDVNIVTEGDTVTEALMDAKERLKLYCQCVLKFDSILEEPTDMQVFKEQYSRNSVLQVECEVNEQEGLDNICFL